MNVGLLVIALTTVRRRSVQASDVMTAGAAAMIVLSIASPVAYSLLARFHDLHADLHAGGIDGYLKLSAVLGIVLSLLRAGAWGLVLLGIYKAATAPTEGTATASRPGSTGRADRP